MAYAHFGLGTLLARQKRHSEAVVSFRKAISLDGTSAQAFTQLGLSLLALGEKPAAVDALKRLKRRCERPVFLPINEFFGSTDANALPDCVCAVAQLAQSLLLISKPVCEVDLMKTTQLLTVAACLLIPLAVQANDIEPGQEFQLATPATNPIVLDGNLSEWSGRPIVNPQFSIPKGSGPAGQMVTFEPYSGGDWTGPNDHSISLQILFDQINVYLGVIVTDEYHEHASGVSWDGDAVQIMIANPARDAQVALYNYALGGVEGALLTTIIDHEAGPGGTDAVVSRNSVTHQTTYEIKLPKESMGIDNLAPGVQFGLGVDVNDGDEATPGQKGWSGLGAHALVFGKSPSETAEVTLVPEPSSLGLSMMGIIGANLLRRRNRQH